MPGRDDPTAQDFPVSQWPSSLRSLQVGSVPVMIRYFCHHGLDLGRLGFLILFSDWAFLQVCVQNADQKSQDELTTPNSSLHLRQKPTLLKILPRQRCPARQRTVKLPSLCHLKDRMRAMRKSNSDPHWKWQRTFKQDYNSRRVELQRHQRGSHGVPPCRNEHFNYFNAYI